MAVRRKLVDEVKPDPAIERNFVLTGKAKPPEGAAHHRAARPPRSNKPHLPRLQNRL